MNDLVAVLAARMYYACMPHVQVRDVPDDVHATLARRAELAGQSLQQYLAAQLAVLAATPTLDDLIDRIERRKLGSVPSSDALGALEADRARR
jgi:antitoxin FitA